MLLKQSSFIVSHVVVVVQVPFTLVGNKVDLEEKRRVSKTDGERRAREWGCDYVETSAKTGKNVEEIYYGILRKVRDKKATSQGSKTKKKGGCIIL